MHHMFCFTEDGAGSCSRLRAIRVQRGVSQERLAALSGLSRGWVAHLDRNGEAMTETAAEKLAPVLGVEPGDLLGMTGSVR
jgi:transcriptional regulator with XRE-family HTH domain